MVDFGVHWYTGINKSGKTTLAWEHAKELVTQTRAPLLLIHHAAENFNDFPHVQSVASAIDSLYRLRIHTYYHARGKSDFDALIRAVVAAGEKGDKIHILIDECRRYANNRYLSAALSDLISRWRHLSHSVHLTTQYFGDINSEAYANGPYVWIFRSTGDRVLQLLKQRYGLDPQTVKTLPQYRYIAVYEGFK